VTCSPREGQWVAYALDFRSKVYSRDGRRNGTCTSSFRSIRIFGQAELGPRRQVLASQLPPLRREARRVHRHDRAIHARRLMPCRCSACRRDARQRGQPRRLSDSDLRGPTTIPLLPPQLASGERAERESALAMLCVRSVSRVCTSVSCRRGGSAGALAPTAPVLAAGVDIQSRPTIKKTSC
jgi:hypothetical protein